MKKCAKRNEIRKAIFPACEYNNSCRFSRVSREANALLIHFLFISLFSLGRDEFFVGKNFVLKKYFVR